MRDRLCSYHEGFQDGWNEAFAEGATDQITNPLPIEIQYKIEGNSNPTYIDLLEALENSIAESKKTLKDGQ